MDPASGIDINGNLVSTAYNDFPNLRWLGYKVGDIDLFSTANSGKWYCVEAHAKLNSVGAQDGIFEFWINDTLQAGSYNLNWHGDWNADPSRFHINAIFIENYWNAGSPVTQERYLDNFVISTERIGCDCASTSATSGHSQTAVFVFPNPTSDQLHFLVDASIAHDGYTLEVSDIHGRRIASTSSISEERYLLPLAQWPPGMYVYRIISKSSGIYQGVFVLQ